MFFLDANLQNSSVFLIDLKLSTVLLKNDSSYPWLILVPRVKDATELYDLNENQRLVLMDEMHKSTVVLKQSFKPDKINFGALGNIVKQLHIHVIARFINDPAWPHGVWQERDNIKAYDQNKLELISKDLINIFLNTTIN